MLSTMSCPLCEGSLSHLSAELAELHINECLEWIALEEEKAHGAKQNSTIKRENVKLHLCVESTVAGNLQQLPLTIKADPGTNISVSDNQSIEDMMATLEISPAKATNVSVVGVDKIITDSQQKADPQPPRNMLKPLLERKKVLGTTFTVDAFNYGALDFCTAYFLTHFHSDHYDGLSGGFPGDIYCSQTTANCILSKFSLDPGQVHVLPMNTRRNVQGVYVTFIDAEHCPGAVVILFEIPGKNGISDSITRIVHTGDFRASRRHVDQITRVFTTIIPKRVIPSMLMDTRRSTSETEMPQIDCIYLDTTFLKPFYSLPKLSQVVETISKFCLDISREPSYLQKHMTSIGNKLSPKKQATSTSTTDRVCQTRQPAVAKTQPTDRDSSKPSKRVLFVVGTYTLGMEKLFVGIAKRLGSKIYVDEVKRKILECIDDMSIAGMLTNDMHEAQVHVVLLWKVSMPGMTEYLESMGENSSFTSIVAFSQAGWSDIGPYVPGRKVTASSLVPQMPSQSELDYAVKRWGAGARAQMLAMAARVRDDEELVFGLHKLKPRGSSSKVTIFPVPYSEHSSFAELAQFICSFDVANVIPTVFSSPEKKAAAEDWLQHWQGLKLLNNSKPLKLMPW